jgi:hypothetical protein
LAGYRREEDYTERKPSTYADRPVLSSRFDDFGETATTSTHLVERRPAYDDARDNDAQQQYNDGNEVVPAVSQEFDQQAESGDVSQSFNVSNTGDNSNQCAGIQGVANTGNAQNQIGVLQYGSEADDFSFEDSGSSINVSPQLGDEVRPGGKPGRYRLRTVVTVVKERSLDAEAYAAEAGAPQGGGPGRKSPGPPPRSAYGSSPSSATPG